MKAEDIAHWPGTPGGARIALAEKLIEDDPQGARTPTGRATPCRRTQPPRKGPTGTPAWC